MYTLISKKIIIKQKKDFVRFNRFLYKKPQNIIDLQFLIVNHHFHVLN